MLTFAPHTGSINIYNTTDWTHRTLNLDGFRVLDAAWTSEDKVLVDVVGNPAKPEIVGKMIDGYTIQHWQDVGIRLLDPLGGAPSKSIWFPAIADIAEHHIPWVQALVPAFEENNFLTSQIALGDWALLDDKTLNIRKYYSVAEIADPQANLGTGGKAFSPDGKYLFVKSTGWFDGQKPIMNAVIDTVKGKEIANFSGENGYGHTGIAISPNGFLLALGNGDSVKILTVKYPQK